MRRRLLTVLIAALALAPLPGHAIDRLVTVVGEGTVTAAPDLARIRVGVSSQAKTAREASDSNAKQMTSVLAAVKEAGIAERDIQTLRLSLQPQYDARVSGAPARLIGFQASNQVMVTVRNIAQVAGVLDRAIGAGANEMSGIEFVVSEQKKLLDKARGDAMADAARKAELYARAAGAKVGHVVSISEENTAPPVYPMTAMRVTAAAVPVAPGEQTLRVSVTVTYELTP